MTDMTVARTILAQLGGNRFIAMTGAKNLVGGDNSLHMDIGRGTKNKATKMKIELDPSDTYTMTFYKWNARDMSLVKLEEIAGVYCDMLQEIFTDRTGFYTKM